MFARELQCLVNYFLTITINSKLNVQKFVMISPVNSWNWSILSKHYLEMYLNKINCYDQFLSSLLRHIFNISIHYMSILCRYDIRIHKCQHFNIFWIVPNKRQKQRNKLISNKSGKMYNLVLNSKEIETGFNLVPESAYIVF